MQILYMSNNNVKEWGEFGKLVRYNCSIVAKPALLVHEFTFGHSK